MSILVFALIVVLVAALMCYAVQRIPLDAPFSWIIEVLIVIIAAAIIANRAGLT